MKRIYYYLILVVFASSCKKAEENSALGTSPALTNTNKNVVLGKKLENPYSVANMRRAYQNLKARKSYSARTFAIDENEITTTHYYVRFLPKDTLEYNKLKTDTSLVLYQIPLDYEVINSGCNDQDTTGKPVWQYTAVENGYQFDSSIEHEILEDLYIPEQSINASPSTSASSPNSSKFVTDLVNEAMKITKNFQDTLKYTGGSTKVSYRPSGRIRVWDTRLNNYVPLIGVQIRGRRWFNFQSTYTDNNGNYSLGYFGGNTNLSIFYETSTFDVRSGLIGQAWFDGPHTNDPWSYDIRDGVQRFYAHVFRGARRYHWGDNGGLRRPYSYSKLKYSAYDKNGSAQGFNHLGALPYSEIGIWRFGSDGVEWASDEIFSTTVHETAHSSQGYIMGNIQVAQVAAQLRESWAVGVEWMITQREYRERGIANYSGPNYERFSNISYPIPDAYQYWSTNFPDQKYTPLYIDLIDDYNQGLNGRPIIDNVRGYTLPQIEGFLKHIYGFSSLSSQLKSHKPAGVTDAQIDELLAQY
jgi:hypothetical protein